MMKIIDNKQIEALGISPAQCVEWVRESFLMKDRAQLKPKIALHPQGTDFITTMPCLLPEEYHSFGVKVVTRIHGRRPALKSEMLMYDSASGHLLAMMDADWITSMRTGATAALAISLLRSTTARTYAMVGLGDIANSVMKCLLTVLDRPIEMKLMRYKDQAERFAQMYSYAENVKFTIVDSHSEFISGSDVIISCVTSQDELFEPDDTLFKPGCLLVPVHVRGFQNCDLCFDKVIGDDTGHISGFKYFDRFRSFTELGEVLAGRAPGRENDSERILSYNYGLALHDVVFGERILKLLP